MGRGEVEAVAQTVGVLDDEVSVSYCDTAQLPLARPRRVYDSNHAQIRRREPFLGHDLAADLPPLIPDAAAGLRDPWSCTWQVDVLIDGHRLPTRSLLSDLLVSGGPAWNAKVRSASDGISYFSHSMGFVPGGVSLEQALARPQLRLPTARDIFSVLLSAEELWAEQSAAGRYSQGVLDLWGGLKPLAEDLRGGATNAILRAYLSQESSSTAPGIRLDVQGRRFLSLQDAAEASGAATEAVRTIIDAYVAKGIMRRGLILQCQRCRNAAWYPLDDLAQAFRCSRCRRESLIIEATWRQPSEPTWYYDLDEIAYQALRHNARVPLLALASLEELSVPSPLLFTTEMDVFKGRNLVAEIDLWMVMDGKVVIGEAKTGNDLEPTPGAERRAAAKLANIAAAVTADQFVLATASASWNPRTEKVMEAALNPYGIELRLMTHVGS
jgi:hypothetical protein